MKLTQTSKTIHTRLLALLFYVVTVGTFQSLANASENDVASNAGRISVVNQSQIRQSALNGSSEAQFELGLMFEYGRGMEQDDSLAAFWYEKSAVQGFAEAQYRLAVLCDNGWGGPADKKKAFNWYKSAAQGGNELAQHDLAIAYFQGSGTAKSLLQAYMWLKIANLSGNPLMQKHLNLVAEEMSNDEIETAEYLARDWFEQSGI